MHSQRLSDLLKRDVPSDPMITGVTADSRRVDAGSLFVALPGTVQDGRAFIPQALARGAAAVLAPTDTPVGTAPVLVTAGDVRRAYALAARGFYGAQPKTSVAVTGTNGKTSVSTFCRQIWMALDLPAVNLGTTGVEGAWEAPLAHTTPEPVTLHRTLAAAAENGITHAAMEASSHGLAQRRLDGVHLQAAGFTNFTQDHLDYHHTFEAYFEAKMRLFDEVVDDDGVAVIWADGSEW